MLEASAGSFAEAAKSSPSPLQRRSLAHSQAGQLDSSVSCETDQVSLEPVAPVLLPTFTALPAYSLYSDLVEGEAFDAATPQLSIEVGSFPLS